MKYLAMIMMVGFFFLVGCQSTQKYAANVGDYYGLTPVESEQLATDVVKMITDGKLPRETTYAMDITEDNTVGYYLHKKLVEQGYAIKTVKQATTDDIITYWWVKRIGDEKSPVLYIRVISGKDDWSRRYDSHNGQVSPTGPFSKGVWE